MVKKIYQNKRNENKFIEVHYYRCGHQRVRQYMLWTEPMRVPSATGYLASEPVKNFTGAGSCKQSRTGRGLLYRWRKGNLNELLEDYTPYVPTDEHVKAEFGKSLFDMDRDEIIRNGLEEAYVIACEALPWFAESEVDR